MEDELRPLLFSLAFALGACKLNGDAPSATSSAALAPSATSSAALAPGATSSAASAPGGAPARRSALLSAEHRRDSRAVTDEDLSSRDVEVRRAAARALARIADRRARDKLMRLLADEDPEVVAFAAYGLGYTCQDGDPALVRALTARAATLIARDPVPGEAKVQPLPAIADALGRCSSADAERTLRAWLGLDRELAEAAASALGRIASRKARLDDATLVALLDAAARPEGLEHALFAFTRLTGFGAAVRARLLDVAKSQLESSPVKATLALRALASLGEEAAPLLGEALLDPRLPSAARAETTRHLARLGKPGKLALGQALARLPERPPLTGPDYALTLAILGALTPPLESGTEILARLATLELPSEPELVRRAVALRCRAAALLAGRATASKNLLACDPDPNGREGALAMLSVLDRGKLEGARYRRYEALVAGDDALVRERALRLLGGHPEAPNPPEVLARALERGTPGDAAAAAEILAKYPELAGAPEKVVIEAVTSAFQAEQKHGPEVQAALIDAAAALSLLGQKSRIERECSSPWPLLRQRAESGLRLLGDRSRSCTDFTPPKEPPAELSAPLERPVTLSLETDAGPLELELDPTFAPVAVTRLVKLAREGFYDKTPFHRVVPGFVVQFGDPTSTGFGGPPLPPLRCETSPLPFRTLSVGVAHAGRDTGNSQIFVTLGRFPHLDGDYTLIGQARGAWDSVAEGDVLRQVRVNASR